MQIKLPHTEMKVLAIAFFYPTSQNRVAPLGIIISSLKFSLAMAGELKLVPNPS
ncbi:hypothetical protein [uncultured Nostoc sp.]|uniref:hypothetical protein n=1 Tax=uncultured Nostoc sp. TaxID=340711 RepID=UPI0035CA509C